MDIAIANYEYPPNSGGGGEFSASLESELDDRGHNVGLVVGGRHGQTSGTRSLLTWPFVNARDLRGASKASDVVNTHFTVPTSVLAPILTGDTPLVVNAMGADIYDPTRYKSLRPFLDAANRWIANGADRLIVPSKDMFRRLPTTIQRWTEIVPYFINEQRYCPPRGYTQPHEPLRLLTVGRLVERKNLKTMLDAVGYLDRQGVDVEYTIAGDGPMRDDLADYATSQCIQDKVTFAGYVDEDELPALYGEHDIFALPSHHEAFGIVVLEALACGLPCMVSDTGGHSDIVTDDVGRSVPANSPAEMADAVLDIRDRYPKQAIAARELVKSKYTADVVVPEYERIYRGVSA